MTMQKNYHYLIIVLVGLLGIISSCSNDEPQFNGINNELQTRSVVGDDTICYLDEKGNIIQPFAAPTDKSRTESIEPFASAEAITVTGYTSKTLIKTETAMFVKQPQDDRLIPYTYYLFYHYTYNYRITIPHNATIVIPDAFDETWKTGKRPSDQNSHGYDYFLISENASGDIYELRTIIQEISYNSLGQYLGFTAYLPFSVGDPADLIWKYSYIEIDWGAK